MAGDQRLGRHAEAQVGGIGDGELLKAMVGSRSTLRGAVHPPQGSGGRATEDGKSQVRSRSWLGGKRTGLGTRGQGHRVMSGRVCGVDHHGPRYSTVATTGMDESRFGMKESQVTGSIEKRPPGNFAISFSWSMGSLMSKSDSNGP